MEKQKLYTVVGYDENSDEVDRVENIKSWTAKEAYLSVMHELKEHKTWAAGTSIEKYKLWD